MYLHLRCYEDTLVTWVTTATAVVTQVILHKQMGPGQGWFAPQWTIPAKLWSYFNEENWSLKKDLPWQHECMLPHD